MRILFVDPPFQRFMGFYRYYYPLGLASMAAVLQQRGHVVEVYDAEHCKEADTLSWAQAALKNDEYARGLRDDEHPLWVEMKSILRDFDPDVVGISVLSVKAPSASKVASICKQFNPNITTIAGADHATVFPSRTLRDTNIDFIVRGEGEATLAELIACLDKGDRSRFDSVAGISYRQAAGIKHNPDRELIADLDSLPFPAIETLVDVQSYRPVDFGAIMASRGCPYRCSFCGVANVWSYKVRYRSPANVVAEVKWLKEKFGTDYFSFRDASFTLNRARIVELCQQIMDEGLNIQWECLTRADLLDDELVNLMKKSGCITIRIGVESGSQEILRYMKKEIDLDSVRSAAKLLDRYDFYWSAYFLFGTPKETKETIGQTLDLIKEIDPPFITPARFAPIPGTEMYDDLVQVDLISPDIDWGLENNQSYGSNYVLAMSEQEFETSMKEVADFVEAHNRANVARMKMRDRRLK